MNEPLAAKACTCCFEIKDIDQFYKYGSIWRGECKTCVSKKNAEHQKITRPWLNRPDPEKRREYQRDYYAKNKQKFLKYRQDFKHKHPNYYKEYYAL